jgi:hypothetical protein
MKDISGWILPLLRRSINNPEPEKVLFIILSIYSYEMPTELNLILGNILE